MTGPLQIDAATAHAIEELVSGGIFDSHHAVLREGVRLVREREGFDSAVDGPEIDHDTIVAIETALDDAEAGRVRPMEDVFADLRRRYPAGS